MRRARLRISARVDVPLADGSPANPVIGREQPVANQPIERAEPGLVRVAPHIGTHGSNGGSRGRVANIDVHVEDKVRHLLHGAGDRQFRSDAPSQPRITATAALQVARSRFRGDRCDVDEREPTRVFQPFPQLASSADQGAPVRRIARRGSRPPRWCRSIRNRTRQPSARAPAHGRPAERPTTPRGSMRAARWR